MILCQGILHVHLHLLHVQLEYITVTYNYMHG